jgi:hypothetical protein
LVCVGCVPARRGWCVELQEFIGCAGLCRPFSQRRGKRLTARHFCRTFATHLHPSLQLAIDGSVSTGRSVRLFPLLPLNTVIFRQLRLASLRTHGSCVAVWANSPCSQERTRSKHQHPPRTNHAFWDRESRGHGYIRIHRMTPMVPTIDDGW